MMMDKMDNVMPKLLENSLKQLNVDMHLKSWTINEISDQIQLIIRFVNPDNKNPITASKSDTFVKKTKYHKGVKQDQGSAKNEEYQ